MGQVYTLVAANGAYALAPFSPALNYKDHIFGSTAAFGIVAAKANYKQGVVVNENVQLTSPTGWTWNTPIVQGIGTQAVVPTYDFRPGTGFFDTVLLLDTADSQTRFGVEQVDLIALHDAMTRVIPWAISENLGINDVDLIARGAAIADLLGLSDLFTTKNTYYVAVTQALALNASFRNFFGEVISDILLANAVVSTQYRPGAAVADTVGLHEVLANSLLFHMTVAEGVDVTDTQLLHMIFKGLIADGVKLSALHVMPGGEITAWAVNTINNAVTQYTNFDFNSFAQQGVRYLAASKTGLYVLDGNRDGTSNIIPAIKSGFASFNGSHLTGMAAIYLGMRGEGDFFLKLEAGDGRIYTYGVKTQPHFMTTKVNPGKGLRSRYWRYELIGTGPAFDLDSIEFVPMMGKRRV